MEYIPRSIRSAPISLDLMADAVILSTGQRERERENDERSREMKRMKRENDERPRENDGG